MATLFFEDEDEAHIRETEFYYGFRIEYLKREFLLEKAWKSAHGLKAKSLGYIHSHCLDLKPCSTRTVACAFE